MRIAVVQFQVDDRSQEFNWLRMEEYMAAASKKKADLIVFPECFLGGFSKPDFGATENVGQKISALARKYQIDLVPGSIYERDPEDGHIYNTTYYVDKDGSILLQYRKVHLWIPERERVSQGNLGFGTATNRFGIVVGLCLCWDLNFPEGFRQMALESRAQLIIVPAYWSFEDAGKTGMEHDPMSEVKFVDSMCTSRAFENEICLVFCNAAHLSSIKRPLPSNSIPIGHSQITVPFKGPVVRCDHSTEEMILADVDIKSLTQDAEDAYWVRKDWDNGYIYGRHHSKL
ncbi:hypothetical protein DFQ28_005071 [Apophysomyces sp. BC1034]|nr:hypothetical protein DFQ30_010413 [Apophysomyces sp. BC1015]KAG0181856.1 hypothetical protein DFQ29_006782 [Apophysomyces sp. BC1021]KAG0193467.1 hypothetical protein DFQ28_005071 [Apophysomyces sp. BC1034]